VRNLLQYQKLSVMGFFDVLKETTEIRQLKQLILEKNQPGQT